MSVSAMRKSQSFTRRVASISSFSASYCSRTESRSSTISRSPAFTRSPARTGTSPTTPFTGKLSSSTYADTHASTALGTLVSPRRTAQMSEATPAAGNSSGASTTAGFPHPPKASAASSKRQANFVFFIPRSPPSPRTRASTRTSAAARFIPKSARCPRAPSSPRTCASARSYSAVRAAGAHASFFFIPRSPPRPRSGRTAPRNSRPRTIPAPRACTSSCPRRPDNTQSSARRRG